MLPSLLPADITPDTFNSQYLQRHSLSPPAVLASAKVSRMLDTPREDLEAILFTTLGEGVPLCIKVTPIIESLSTPVPHRRCIQDASSIISFLGEINSPRIDEYRTACQARFSLSTVFKSPKELLELQKRIASNAPPPGEDPETIE